MKMRDPEYVVEARNELKNNLVPEPEADIIQDVCASFPLFFYFLIRH